MLITFEFLELIHRNQMSLHLRVGVGQSIGKEYLIIAMFKLVLEAQTEIVHPKFVKLMGHYQ